MFQSNAQFFDAYRQQMAALQKEYNMKMQEINANMRSYNPYGNYQQQVQPQYAPATQQTTSVATGYAATPVVEEQAAPVVPVNLQILAILGELKTLISEMNDSVKSNSTVISSGVSGTESATESVNTETVNKQ